MVNRYLTIHAMQKGGEKIETAVFFATTTFVMMMRWTTTLIAKKNVIGRYMYFQFTKCCLWIFLTCNQKLLYRFVYLKYKRQDWIWMSFIGNIKYIDGAMAFISIGSIGIVLYFQLYLNIYIWICYLHVFQNWMQ